MSRPIVDESVLRSAIELSSTGILFFDGRGLNCLDMNDQARRLLGYARSDMFSLNLESLAAPSERGAWRASIHACRESSEPRVLRTFCQSKDGQQRPMEARMRYFQQESRSCIVLALIDLTDREHIERLSRSGAFRDSLTHLPNRVLFESRLMRATRRSGENGSPLAILMIDVDNFKLVNDTYGHIGGDIVLRVIADRLSHCVRRSEVVARYGGDEFVTLIDNIGSSEQALVVAWRMSDVIKEPIPMGDADAIRVSASIGVAVALEFDSPNHHQLVQWADSAMYQAKEMGRSGEVVLYGDDCS